MTEPEEQAIRRQQWNVDRLKQELGQKQTVLSNLQSEYEELCIFMTEKDHLQEELDALSLAGETIQSLSVQMQSRIGDRLKTADVKNAVIADEWPLSAGEYG